MDKETQALIERVAEDAVNKAVCDTLLLFGMDSKDPLKSQRNMVAIDHMRELMEDPNFRENMQWVSDIRESTAAAKKKGLTTAVGVLVTFLIGIVILGFRAKFESFFGG